MDDYRIKVGFLTHPKTVKLKRKLGAEAVLAFLQLIEFCTVTAGKRSGVLVGMDSDDIEIAAEWTGDPGTLVVAFEAVGFLDRCGNGEWAIHDFHDHNPYVASGDKRRVAAQKASNARWNRKSDAESHADLCDPQCGSDETAMRNPEIRNAPSPSPSPSPDPTPIPSPNNSAPSGALAVSEKSGELADIKTVQQHYLLRWPKRKAQAMKETNRKKIRARLREGYTAEQLCNAIDGNLRSEFHVTGGHDSLELIVRNSEKVDRFLKEHECPTALTGRDRELQAVMRADPDMFDGVFDDPGDPPGFDLAEYQAELKKDQW